MKFQKEFLQSEFPLHTFITAKQFEMAGLQELKKHLKPGKVYRRADLKVWSKAVDRHLAALVADGFLQKLSGGLYHLPKYGVFGALPPDDKELVRQFLKDDDFLISSPNDYNMLGVGTTQLYNKRVVFNHKRHGEFVLGGLSFTFLSKHRFPKKISNEFLLVDLLNNLTSLSEDKEVLLQKVVAKIRIMEPMRLKKSAALYGSVKVKNLIFKLLQLKNGAYEI